jgi:hypothetical protein
MATAVLVLLQMTLECRKDPTTRSLLEMWLRCQLDKRRSIRTGSPDVLHRLVVVGYDIPLPWQLMFITHSDKRTDGT